MAKKKREVTPQEIDELADFFEDNPIYNYDEFVDEDLIPFEDREYKYKKGGKIGVVARQVKGFGKARKRSR